MAQLIGCWKGDCTKYQNYDAFAKASGIPENMVEMFRTADTSMEYKKNGEIWTCIVKSSAFPEKTYEFKAGEEVTTIDPLGKAVKFTITIESDNRMTETTSSEMMGWKTVKVVREVKGNCMISTHELDGVTMTAVLTRC